MRRNNKVVFKRRNHCAKASQHYLKVKPYATGRMNLFIVLVRKEFNGFSPKKTGFPGFVLAFKCVRKELNDEEYIVMCV